MSLPEVTPPQTEAEDLNLEEFDLHTLEDATKGQRILNKIIDGAIVVAGTIGLVVIIEIFTGADIHTGYRAAFCLMAAYVIYYSAFEGFMNGRTIGKLVTRTRAVNYEGQPISLKQAFTRSCCRLLGMRSFRIVHDKWTKTRVVKIKNTLQQ